MMIDIGLMLILMVLTGALAIEINENRRIRKLVNARAARLFDY